MPLQLDVDWTIDLQGVVNRLIRTPLLNSGVDIFPVPEIRECLFANVGQEMVQEKFYFLRFDSEHPICLLTYLLAPCKYVRKVSFPKNVVLENYSGQNNSGETDVVNAFPNMQSHTLPSNEPRRMEEHEDWVAEVVIDVGDDIENHQQRPDQVVLDVV